MDEQGIKTLLKRSGIPFAYRMWPVGKAPPLPHGIFLFPGSHNFGADGIVYAQFNTVHIELYTKTKDPASEQRIEDVLDSAGIFWEKTETYISSQQMQQTLYEIEV